MSYYFTLNFQEIADLHTGIRLAKSCLDWLVSEHAETIINRNKLAIPSNQFIKERNKIEDWWFWHVINRNWLQRIFIFDFLYWPEYNLLALDYDLPEPQDFFPFSFELNSVCDDISYDCEFWEKSNIKFFMNKANKVKALLPYEVNDELSKMDLKAPEAPFYDTDRAELLYHLIYDDLDIDGLIYSPFTYEQFSLSAINNENKLEEVSKIMEKYILSSI